MESMTLPDLTDRSPAHAVAERRAGSRNRPPRERFAPLWLRASLILATVGALGLLYPKDYIESRLQRGSAPSAAALAYLRLMVRAQPAVTETRVLLAQQALSAGELALAHHALAPWAARRIAALPPNIALLRLRLLRAELYTQLPTSERHAALAQAYTRDVLLFAAHMTPSELLREARFAAALGQYRTAADLYRQVISQSRDPAMRLEAFYAGIEALRAAGQPLDALAFARHELTTMPPSAELWRALTRLALLADAPRVAAQYARRLVGLEPP